MHENNSQRLEAVLLQLLDLPPDCLLIRFLHDLDGFSTHASQYTLRILAAIVAPRDLPIVIEFDPSFLHLGIIGVADERDPFVDLDYPIVEYPRLVDGKIKDAWSRLVADQKQIPEAFGDQESVSGAFAFQERVGRDRRTQANVV